MSVHDPRLDALTATRAAIPRWGVGWFDGHKAAIVLNSISASQLPCRGGIVELGNAPGNPPGLPAPGNVQWNGVKTTPIPVCRWRRRWVTDAAYGDGDTRQAFADRDAP